MHVLLNLNVKRKKINVGYAPSLFPSIYPIQLHNLCFFFSSSSLISFFFTALFLYRLQTLSHHPLNTLPLRMLSSLINLPFLQQSNTISNQFFFSLKTIKYFRFPLSEIKNNPQNSTFQDIDELKMMKEKRKGLLGKFPRTSTNAGT